jgi:hypothetical protein
MMNGMALMIRFCFWFVPDVFIHEISIFCRIKTFSAYSFGILSMLRALERESLAVLTDDLISIQASTAQKNR